MEEKLQESAYEINKGNEIIQKLKNEVRLNKQKVKQMSQVTMSQEKHI
jgi:hypothetical protein